MKSTKRTPIIISAAGLLLILIAGCSSDMSFFDTVHNRQSIRAYKSTPVPKEHILKIIDAARLAPTSGNQQPWKFIVVQDSSRIQEIKKECIENRVVIYKQYFTDKSEEEIRKNAEKYYNGFMTAPVYIVVLTDNESKYPDYNHHDGPLAAGYLCLAARALGYGTVYTTDSVPEEVTKKVLNIPDRYTRVCFIPLGIPEEWPGKHEKKELEDFIIYESF
jgi:nitroreductase